MLNSRIFVHLVLFALTQPILAMEETALSSPRLKPFYSQRDCGPVSLAVICKLRNIHVSIEQLYQMIPVGKKGTNAAALVNTAKDLGLNPIAVKCKSKGFIEKNTLAIIELKKGHFAVFVGVNVKTGKLLIIDLPNEPYYLSPVEFEKQWGGRAILFPLLSNHRSNSKHLPQVDVTPKVANLGVIWQGDKAVCSFKIQNTGRSELHIIDVRASCGCMITQLDKKILAPGDSANLKLTYESAGKIQKPKDITKRLHIVTNADPSITFMGIKAKVRPRFVVLPKSISMSGSVYTDLSALTQRIKIQFLDDPKTVLTSIKTSVPWLSIKNCPTPTGNIESRNEFITVELNVSSLPSAMGPNVAEALLYTNNSNYPLIRIPVRFNIEGDYEVLPNKIFMGVQEPNKKVARSIRIRRILKDKPFTISTVYSDNLLVKVTEISEAISDEQSFNVQITTPSNLGRFSGDITVVIDNDQNIRIHVFGFTRKYNSNK
jgi:hypothetical protein